MLQSIITFLNNFELNQLLTLGLMGIFAFIVYGVITYFTKRSAPIDHVIKELAETIRFTTGEYLQIKKEMVQLQISLNQLNATNLEIKRLLSIVLKELVDWAENFPPTQEKIKALHKLLEAHEGEFHE